MNTSDYTDQVIPVPPGIPKDILSNPKLCRKYGRFVSAYDSETKCGGLYSLDAHQWVISWPISMQEFADRVAKTVAAAGLANKPDKLN